MFVVGAQDRAYRRKPVERHHRAELPDGGVVLWHLAGDAIPGAGDQVVPAPNRLDAPLVLTRPDRIVIVEQPGQAVPSAEVEARVAGERLESVHPLLVAFGVLGMECVGGEVCGPADPKPIQYIHERVGERFNSTPSGPAVSKGDSFPVVPRLVGRGTPEYCDDVFYPRGGRRRVIAVEQPVRLFDRY